MTKRFTFIGIMAIAGAAPGWAQEPVAEPADACAVKTAYLATLETKYQDEQDAIRRDGEEIGQDGSNITISGTVDVQMKDQRFVFDLPTVTMETKRMALDLPQTTMKTRKLSWDHPETVMRRVKIGEHPEVTCRGFKCTVRWKANYMDVPAIEMRRKDISLDVPEFRMDRTEFKTDVPKFGMDRQEWILKIPEITLRNISAEAEKLERRSADLKVRAEGLAARIQEDAVRGSSEVFQCYRDDIATKRTTIAQQFDSAIAQMEAGIGAINGAGGDASKVASDGTVVDLIQQRDALIAQRAEALAKIDAVVEDLIAREKAAATKIVT